MTHFEKLGWKAAIARSKAEHSSGRMREILLEKWGRQNDPRVVEALSQGVDAFQEAVRDRVLRDHPEVVNRCPRCARLARTPKAKQCRWCYFQWRDD